MAGRTSFLLLLFLSLLAGCIGAPIHAKTKARPIPDDFGFPYERVEIPVPDQDDVVLRGVWAEKENGPPVLVLYGSGMGVNGARELIDLLYRGGYSVLCCDYRGTGYSSGSWWWNKSRKLDDDARALWEWMRREKGEPAGVVGVSIGAIAATGGVLTHEHPPAIVVLDRPVDPRTVIRNFMRMALGPISATISVLVARAETDVDMRAQIAAAKPPTLVMLPADDMLLPPEEAARMLADRPDHVDVFVTPGGHVSSHLVKPLMWRHKLLDTLDAVLRPGLPKTGRGLPPDPAEVLTVTLEDCVLDVYLDRPAAELPETFKILVIGRAGCGLIQAEERARRLRWRIPRRKVRRIGEVMTARVVPDDFFKGTGTTWIFDPENEKDRAKQREARRTTVTTVQSSE